MSSVCAGGGNEDIRCEPDAEPVASESPLSAPIRRPPPHTQGLRAAPVSFLRVHWVLKRWRGATMSGGAGDPGPYPLPGTPGYAR